MYLKSEAMECNSSTTIEAVIAKYLQTNGWINSSWQEEVTSILDEDSCFDLLQYLPAEDL